MVSYARIQMFVAFVDAVGIGVGAAIIGVPLALPLGVLVFIGSFIPVVGALVTGAIAVLLALVANGPVNALIMLAIVLAGPAAGKPHPAAAGHGQGRVPASGGGHPVRRGRLLPGRNPRGLFSVPHPRRSKLRDSLHCCQNVGT